MVKRQSVRQFAFRLALLVGAFSWIYWRFMYQHYGHLPWGARVIPPFFSAYSLIFPICAFISVALSLSYVGHDAPPSRSVAVAASVAAGVVAYGMAYSRILWWIFQTMGGLRLEP